MRGGESVFYGMGFQRHGSCCWEKNGKTNSGWLGLCAAVGVFFLISDILICF